MASKFVAASSLAVALAPALAQSDLSLLPEGSKELTLGATLGSSPSRYGSAARSTYLLPQFSVEWSNGIFVEGLVLGMHMSDAPLLRYGPLLALDFGTQLADGSTGKFRPVAGGFINYVPVQELSLHAHVFTPLGDAGRVRLNARAGTQATLAPRHQLFAGVGANLLGGGAMQADFGTANYRPSGGVRDVYADLRWQWQFSAKYTLISAVQASRLLGDAAASPRTSERTGVTTSVTLRYGY
ncbi:MipA/OmpV family protein [Massilia sp. Root351]|uniref:MipA/OmpV family protein n=1 Tax=Massilia sp. Root351 TaxID=1736522 RepID=UPI00138EF558|nr:MipA/OmpV family protein [Massilia sp. Root351]